MRRFAKVERILPKVLFVCALLYWLTCSTFAESGTAQSGIEEMLHRAAQEGKLAYKLTTPEELKVLLGSEGKGIRHGIKKHLELKVSLPMKGAALSFNVAMACAIFCYEIGRQKALKKTP